jgi:hypothetical protein
VARNQKKRAFSVTTEKWIAYVNAQVAIAPPSTINGRAPGAVRRLQATILTIMAAALDTTRANTYGQFIASLPIVYLN